MAAGAPCTRHTEPVRNNNSALWALWNSRYTDRAVTALEDSGRIVDPADIGRISRSPTKRPASTAATTSTSPKPYGKATSDPSLTPNANSVPLVPGPHQVERRKGGLNYGHRPRRPLGVQRPRRGHTAIPFTAADTQSLID
jgi:hypothetical protein